MTLAVPTHLADTLGAATASGVEAAGHLLHDVGHAVNSAASATTGRYRKLVRSVRGGHKPSSVSRNFLLLAAVAVLAAVIMKSRKPKAAATSVRPGVSDDKPMADKLSSDEMSNDKMSNGKPSKNSSDAGAAEHGSAVKGAHTSN